MHKIYSRFRFKIPELFFQKVKDKKQKIKIKKTSKVLIIFLIAVLTANTIYNYINPIFIRLCEAEVKSIATIVSNEQATRAVENYSYEDLFEIEKDNNGKVIMIKSNVITINEIISNVAVYIQHELNKEDRTNINIPLGSLFGNSFVSGSGPEIKAKLVLKGVVDTDLRSEFISKGINQTLHRIYLQIDCKVSIITSFKKIESNVSNQVLLMENVVLGEIPETYYNLEGITDPVEVVQ